MRSILKPIRLILALLLWTATLFFALTGLGRLAEIFTGDDSFGAYDGFQFTDALYGATIRFVAAAITGYLVWRVLRWQNSGKQEPSAPKALVRQDPSE